MSQANSTAEGWRQVEAGLALVQWSNLVQWDSDDLVLAAVDENKFESDHQAVHPRFGRLISWIAFSAGAEYLAKGACFLKGKNLTKATSVIRIPSVGENLQAWVDDVFNQTSAVRQQSVSFGIRSDLDLG